MKLTKLASLGLLTTACATLWAQDPAIDTAPPREEWGPRAGDRELTLGGSAASNTDFDDSAGGINGSYGMYLSDTLSVSLRQSVTYVNPNAGGTSWNGSTRVAIDKHILSRGNIRPFVGANIGGIYGDTVKDTWAAGLEAGAKFYVKPKTFIFAMVEYAWLFDDAEDVEDTFDDGQLLGTVGIGFNF